MEFLERLQCPITKNGLELINQTDFSTYNIPNDFEKIGKLTSGLIDTSKQYFYPIFDEIIVLHEQYALYIGHNEDIREQLSFDKKRVFDYYNEVNLGLRIREIQFTTAYPPRCRRFVIGGLLGKRKKNR